MLKFYHRVRFRVCSERAGLLINSKKALIFGVTGQDGSYLTELLLSKGYEVHGARRRSSSFNTGRIDHLISDANIWNNKFFLHYASLEDSNSIEKLISNLLPDEIYNLAAQSHVGLSFEQPIYSSDIDGLGNLRILESIRNQIGRKNIKFYQASTSELFGGEVADGINSFNELSALNPRSPYATSKLMAYWNTKIYRDAYGIKAFNGILFNHESPRRGETFVTRKITRGLANIKLGNQELLTLGNIYSVRDWGHAKDYVEAMWLMMQQDLGNDLVISSGSHFSVKDFVNAAASKIGMNLSWEGTGKSEIAIDSTTGKVIIKIDESYFRPLDVNFLLGDSALAKKIIGWKPKISFESLVTEMIEFDFKRAQIDKIHPGSHRT